MKSFKTRLKAAIDRLIEAEVQDSWKGGGDAESIPHIEEELVEAKKALNLILKEIKVDKK